jgi:acylphosphatase
MSSAAIRYVVIRGRVQGVGYRAFAEYTALDHGLGGWVRNRRDGAVEAVFAGPAAAVTAMVEACRKGPPGARVEAIEERAGTPDELALRGSAGFAVLPTG